MMNMNMTVNWRDNLLDEPVMDRYQSKPTIRSWRDLANHVANGESPDWAVSSNSPVARAWNTYSGGAAGGYLLDLELAQQVWDKARAIDGPLARCLLYRTKKHELWFPAFTETSRASGSRLGGIQAFFTGTTDDVNWSAESNSASYYGASQPKVANIHFVPQRCLIYSNPFSRDLLADSDLVVDMLNYAAHLEIRYVLQDAMVNGVGMGEPLGIINAPSTVKVTRAGGAGTTTLSITDIDNMWSQLWPYCRRDAIWMCQDKMLFKIDQIATTNNWPASVYLPMGFNGNPYALIKGRPLIPVEQMPALGGTGDLAVGSWREYMLAIHQFQDSQTPSPIEIGYGLSIESKMSEHVLFDTDSVRFRYKLRVDGKPLWTNTVTGTDTQVEGPFVVLK